MLDPLKHLFGLKKHLVLSIFLLYLLPGPFLFPGTETTGGTDKGGLKFLENYGPRVYISQPQNWAIVQGKNEIIYVANQGDLLEFDGISWCLGNRQIVPPATLFYFFEKKLKYFS